MSGAAAVGPESSRGLTKTGRRRTSWQRTALGALAFLLATGAAVLGAAVTDGTAGPLNTTVELFSSSASTRLGDVSTWLPLGFAFAAGMVSAVNPCGFSMLAPYLGLYLGTDTRAEQGRRGSGVVMALKVGGTVTLGFVLLFGAVGLSIGLGANALVRVFPWVGLLLGVSLIAAGSWMVSGGKLYTATAQAMAARIDAGGQGSLKGYLFFGVSYGTASLSCTLPIFLSVVGGSIAVGGAPSALGQFVLYALGMGAVILALTLALAIFKAGMSARLRAVLPFVEPVGAALMLLAGSYVVYYWLTIGGLGERLA